MTTLYLAWQDSKSRRWFPVGQLDADESVEPNAYAFSYISGASDIRQDATFCSVPGFPELWRRYQSSRLFPFFRIGWLPRYLVDDLQQDGVWTITDAAATVAQVNLDAPLSHRLLVDFTGKLPPGFRMDDLPQYQPLPGRTTTSQTNPPAKMPTPCSSARPPRCSPSGPPPRCKSHKPGCE